MNIIRNPKELQATCMKWREQGLTVGLVPTMGFFHDGHLALMDEARGKCDKLIVTLFVNPTQFGEGEDLDAYPADFDRDSSLAEKRGVDILFAPVKDDMYETDHATWIDVPDLAANLCGASRPGHFRGVCTVVAKLFMLAQPNVAVFGQKDWQQLAIIRRMVRDLNMPVEIIGHPIVREKDGLAMSSRNAYLTAKERAQAPAINFALKMAEEKARQGVRDTAALIQAVQEHILQNVPGSRIDYVEVVEPESISLLTEIGRRSLMAVAVYVGKARLIDNNLIEV